MTENILALISNLIGVMILYAFLKSVLKSKAEKPLDYILLVVLYLGYVLSAFTLGNFVLKMAANVIVAIIITIPVFKVSLKKSILANLAYVGFILSLELIALLILERISDAKGLSQLTLQKGAFIADLICQFTVLIIVYVFNLVFRKGVFSNLDFKGWFIFAFFPLFTIISCVALVIFFDFLDNDVVYYTVVFLAAGMVILNILTFFLLDNVVRRETAIREKEIMLEQTEHLNQMYRSLSDEREKQKARSHDYMNHLNVMLMLAHEGKIDEQIRYIEEQLGKEVQTVDIIDTGNTLINAVLNIKYLEAKEKGIIIPFIADNLKGIKISDSDLVTILTNILDNAIEAVQKCDEKRIVFKIIKDYNTLIIDSTNPYTGTITDEDRLITSKEDKKNHGFGLANIKNTVKANNGNCFIDTEGGNFHISITLPLA